MPGIQIITDGKLLNTGKVKKRKTEFGEALVIDPSLLPVVKKMAEEVGGTFVNLLGDSNCMPDLKDVTITQEPEERPGEKAIEIRK